MHSEGPWEVYENSVRTVAPGRCVARMDWDVRDATDDANARLIAAAPDLLAALMRIANGPWPDGLDSPEAQAKWDEQIARAAIAKATNNQ